MSGPFSGLASAELVCRTRHSSPQGASQRTSVPPSRGNGLTASPQRTVLNEACLRAGSLRYRCPRSHEPAWYESSRPSATRTPKRPPSSSLSRVRAVAVDKPQLARLVPATFRETRSSAAPQATRSGTAALHRRVDLSCGQLTPALRRPCRSPRGSRGHHCPRGRRARRPSGLADGVCTWLVGSRDDPGGPCWLSCGCSRRRHSPDRRVHRESVSRSPTPTRARPDRSASRRRRSISSLTRPLRRTTQQLKRRRIRHRASLPRPEHQPRRVGQPRQPSDQIPT